MKELSICPLTIYTFKCEPQLLNEVLSEIKLLKFKKNENHLISISESHYKNNNLLNWIDTCIEEVRKVKFKNIEKFVITNCWVNETRPLQTHTQHRHSNSYLSGVLHLTSHDSGELDFMVPDMWYNHERIISMFEDIPMYYKTSIKAEAGNLILFPSTLIHKTSTLKLGESIRYSIGFNAFPSGKIPFKDYSITASLELQPKNVREL